MGSYLDYRFVTSFTPVEMTFTNKKSKGYVEMPQFIACPDPPLYTGKDRFNCTGSGADLIPP